MTDFLLDSNNSLQINSGGDFKIGETSYQDCGLIMQYRPGDLKSDPTLGVGIQDLILGSITPSIKNKINRELGNDGYKLKEFKFDSDGILQISI